jgi:enhancing lycopene biosynthesis protein 2
MVGEKRAVLVEAARIARGAIKPLGNVLAGEVDAVILPGGYGVVKNLSNFATKGADCEVNRDLARLLRDLRAAGKPIGLICIAPAVGARVLASINDKPHLKVRLTVGHDAQTARVIEAMGAQHVPCAVDDVVVDEANKVVSTPAYMLAQSIDQAEAGISKLVREVLRLCGV